MAYGWINKCHVENGKLHLSKMIQWQQPLDLLFMLGICHLLMDVLVLGTPTVEDDFLWWKLRVSLAYPLD